MLEYLLVRMKKYSLQKKLWCEILEMTGHLLSQQPHGGCPPVAPVSLKCSVSLRAVRLLPRGSITCVKLVPLVKTSQVSQGFQNGMEML